MRRSEQVHVLRRDSHYQGISIPVKRSNDQKFHSTGEATRLLKWGTINVARSIRDIVSERVSCFYQCHSARLKDSHEVWIIEVCGIASSVLVCIGFLKVPSKAEGLIDSFIHRLVVTPVRNFHSPKTVANLETLVINLL